MHVVVHTVRVFNIVFSEMGTKGSHVSGGVGNSKEAEGTTFFVVQLQDLLLIIAACQSRHGSFVEFEVMEYLLHHPLENVVNS